MRSNKELTSLFTTYFSDRLSPSEIDTLVLDVMMGLQNRSVRTRAATEDLAANGQAAQPKWSAEFA